MIAFSVVMPLHDKARYVRAAVDSVLNQRLPPMELIVVDDGSTDGGLDRLADCSDPRLRTMSQSNAGVAAARNRGLTEARGEWVAFIDADDLWRSDHLAEIARVISVCPAAAMVSTRIREFTGAPPPEGDRAQGVVAASGYFGDAARDARLVTSSSAALRRTALSAIGGFRDLRPGEDLDCWVRMALVKPFAHSTRETACYRRATGGAMDIWSGGAQKPVQNMSYRAELGGAVAVLETALVSGEHEARRGDIERFVDARIIANAGRCLAAGDPLGARQRLRLAYHRRGTRHLFYTLLSWLPRGVMTRVIMARRMVWRRRLSD